jgi:hypothetical protein
MPPDLPPPAIVQVMTDHGGKFRSYLDDGRTIYEIVGTCESFCTLRLGLPRDRLCIGHQAWLGFHRAASTKRMSAEAGTRVMWAGYSAKLQARLGELTDHVVYLRGRELIAMGYRECGH